MKHYALTNASINYERVPSAVFSRPEAATVGLSELAARDKHGSKVKCYSSSTTPMLYSLARDEQQEKVLIKIVTVGDSEEIVGIHTVGEHAADMIQCLGVAVAKGITKQELDDSFGIHPTIGEEFMCMD